MLGACQNSRRSHAGEKLQRGVSCGLRKGLIVQIRDKITRRMRRHDDGDELLVANGEADK